MKSNIGSTDRTVRLVVGTVLAVSGVAVFAGVSSLGPVVGGVALLLGAVLLGTALANVCLLYELVGVDTT
ncbi:DUF2892 domain-containing protein [Halosimplex litoreum]|uniref:DUF2892 domain-containing protein n=1 Tax=Halosimplex litoreum TaxID=1198301 RepID=A0A7T3G0L3_9EURY|nr:DUF2892 domain-containing protein [Halosimplex litoreum]QPV64176.1 DUF2892 domain-containing protein [Halosimplex litoreum]